MRLGEALGSNPGVSEADQFYRHMVPFDQPEAALVSYRAIRS